MSGVTAEDILKAADWFTKGTFQKFYYKPTHSTAFGTSVLVVNKDTLKSHVEMETEPFKVLFSNGSGHAMAVS